MIVVVNQEILYFDMKFSRTPLRANLVDCHHSDAIHLETVKNGQVKVKVNLSQCLN
jgi:hypothetical protein